MVTGMVESSAQTGRRQEPRQCLLASGIDASEVDEQPWGRFVSFEDPDGNRWALQELPQRG